jgi:hypothetical protein
MDGGTFFTSNRLRRKTQSARAITNQADEFQKSKN